MHVRVGFEEYVAMFRAGYVLLIEGKRLILAQAFVRCVGRANHEVVLHRRRCPVRSVMKLAKRSSD